MGATHFLWRVREPRTGRWRVLRWKMTAAAAAAWAASQGVIEIEKVEGSAETREDHYGRGYGQHVPPAPGKE